MINATLPTQRRHTTEDDSGTALLMVLGSLIIIATLGIMLVGITLSETKPTIFQRESNQSIMAARAGVTSAVGRIRAAHSTIGGELMGDLAALPCGTWTGIEPGMGINATYTVTVRYYSMDPSTHNDTWRTNNALPCGTGAAAMASARYALVKSIGAVPKNKTDSQRHVEAIYIMSKVDTKEIGGLIRVTHESAGGPILPVWGDLCWTADSLNITGGQGISAQTCDDTEPDNQRWVYRLDYHIMLGATANDDGSGGLCLDGTWTSSTNINLTLQPCADIRSQKWFFNPYWTFEALNHDSDTLSGYCISTNPHNVTDDVTYAGEKLTVGSTYKNGNTMCGEVVRTAPSKKVGASSFGRETNQLVNFEEFSRCMDVKEANPWLYEIISYGCQTNPVTGTPWNQHFTWDEGGTSRIYTGIYPIEGEEFCLKGGTEGTKTFAAQCHHLGDYGEWTVYDGTVDENKAYTIVNNRTGLCLGLDTNNTWSVVTNQTCTGEDHQKWNARYNSNTADVQKVREVRR